MTPTYAFTEADSQRAYDEWGANCGPNALAFILGVPLDAVRGMIPDFETRRYTSPTMMKAAVKNMRATLTEFPAGVDQMFQRHPALVRVQWTGPWTAPGANPKWAYRQTHWIVAYVRYDGDGAIPTVFDVNGGIRGFGSWQLDIVPVLTASIPRADGGWFPTHVWRVDRGST